MNNSQTKLFISKNEVPRTPQRSPLSKKLFTRKKTPEEQKRLEIQKLLKQRREKRKFNHQNDIGTNEKMIEISKFLEMKSKEKVSPPVTPQRPTSAFFPKTPKIFPARARIAFHTDPKHLSVKTPRQETDVFVKEIQRIERLNKTPKSPIRRTMSQPEVSPIKNFDSRTSTPLSTNSSFNLSEIKIPSPKSPDDTKKEIKLNEIAKQEPLRLQYDPNQEIERQPHRLRDLQMMASACKRAGKTRMEGLCHYKMACLYEEMQKPLKAANHYKIFLGISQTLKDDVGTCLAMNCLGVLYQKMGGEYLKNALEYHMKHWEMADIQGKIVAHINMGLVFARLNDLENASENFRIAFQYAVDIHDEHGESIALANLGLLGKDVGDFGTAQVCIERHLVLSEYMNDDTCKSEAHYQLGLLALKKADYPTAILNLEKAREIAIEQGDQIKANQIKCMIGAARGNLNIEEYFKNVK